VLQKTVALVHRGVSTRLFVRLKIRYTVSTTAEGKGTHGMTLSSVQYVHLARDYCTREDDHYEYLYDIVSDDDSLSIRIDSADR